MWPIVNNRVKKELLYQLSLVLFLLELHPTKLKAVHLSLRSRLTSPYSPWKQYEYSTGGLSSECAVTKEQD
jgi:hypothetical protein